MFVPSRNYMYEDYIYNSDLYSLHNLIFRQFQVFNSFMEPQRIQDMILTFSVPICYIVLTFCIKSISHMTPTCSISSAGGS